MSIDLKDRVAIITGGANGIGQATAEVFARAGAAVAIWDYDRDRGQAIVNNIRTAGGQAHFSQVDVTSTSNVDSAVSETLSQFGRIDILINNAGITRDAQLIRVRDGNIVGKMEEVDFDRVIDVNLKGVFICTQAVAQVMINQRYGRIISAASIVGLYGNFGQTNYAASKAAVIGMTKTWARELGKYGITVNAVAPGFIETNMTQAMPEQVRALMLERTPVRRTGQPGDVAHAYAFLASDDASFISGAVLNIDGGLVIGT